MRSIISFLPIFCLILLTACGNANDGKPFKPYLKASSQAPLSNNSINPPNMKLLYCKSPTLFSPFPDFNEMFAGSVVCPGEGIIATKQSSMVRLKVGGNMPINARLCMIPFVNNSPAVETCFSINGQADVVLSTDQYSSVAVVAEVDLPLYKSYLINPEASVPRRIVYTL